jgi:putative adenylate-forming enzyme
MRKFKSRKTLTAFQYKKLNKFAAKTLSKSRFYLPYFSNGIFQWEAVPQITKKEFLESFDEINTKGVKINEAMEVALQAEVSRDFKSVINGITVGLSTGTSGKRALFLVSENERAQWAALVITRVIKPKLFKKQKVAFFLRSNSNLYSSISSGFFEFKYFDIFKPLSELLIELDAYKPNILASQPSILMDIAQAQKNGSITICPNQIISFAEVLSVNDKSTISTIFKVDITEVYQCTEGFLGSTCQFGTMHLNEDFIHFEKEWIDDDKFYPIITDFSRHSQPVVKYKLNDILQVKKTVCACGSNRMAIEKIIGRDDDVLIFKNIKVYPDLLARKIALCTDRFQKYTITQVTENRLQICIFCSDSTWIEVKTAFHKVISNFFNELGISEIDYEYLHNPKEVAGAKNRKIVRLTH